MKIIPRRILKILPISTAPNNHYGIYIESGNSDKNIILTGTMKENAEPSILKDLIDKYAYASTLLYFVENFNIDNDINKNDLLEDINVLLHSRCRVVNEKAPLLTKIGDYPIYEASNYILRGDGVKKIKESFNLKEDVDINDITPEFLKTREYDDVIKGFITCPKCKNVFEEDALIEDYNDYPDDYNGPIDNDPISFKCPYCGYETRNEENFSDAWIDDLEDAPNKSEYISSDLQEGTQAFDIAAKVDYSFQSAPTPANPSSKRKYEAIEIKELDESTYLNLTGFIKDVDGFYKRGNYVLVKESATNKLTVIHKSKLKEAVIEKINQPKDISKIIKDKVEEKYNDRYEVKTGDSNIVNGIIISDKTNNPKDLIELTDFINSIMSSLKYDKTDYEIDTKKNNLVITIFKEKNTKSEDKVSQSA
ncbi:MAG: hypothetical protein IJF92_00050 [Bacilli bacterium]|nr:hypothetical protein [Bacilli bacterium]MBQ3307619.1 hypothetical protein [Bacilli bacterium]